MYLLSIAFVCLSIMQPFLCYGETVVHDNVIFEYLGIDAKSVSNHTLTTISVPKIHKRDVQQGTAIKFQAIDEEISLWLRPRDSILASDETPVYHAHYAPGYPNGVYFEKLSNAMRGVRQHLEDPEHYATVVFGSDDSGKTTVNGYLRSPQNNARLVISSLPEHVVKGSLGDLSSIDDLIDHSTNFTYHVIIELNDDDDLQNIARKGLRGAKFETTSLSKPGPGNANTSNQNGDTLYAQLLITLDYTNNNQWSDKPLTACLEYVLAFWNGVDLIYRQIENPKIRLNIAGIIIATDFQATPYLIGNEVVEDESYYMDDVINEAEKFFYSIEKSSPIAHFDAAIVMTKMYGVDRVDPTYVGYGYGAGHGTICWRDDVLQKNHAVAVIYDNGAHAGIFTAAHEIGHLLGAFDEDDSSHIQCKKARNGSLMESDPAFFTNRIKLTECALEDIRENFKNGALDCLYNVPPMTGTRLPGLMPGKTSNIFKQCEALGYGVPCLPNGTYVDVCGALWCTSFNDTSICEQTRNAAPAGISCLKDSWTEYGVCLKSRCVSV